MKIKLLHAHFLISTENYCNERIGFTVELEEGETAENVVPKLREKAVGIVGPQARQLYQDKLNAERNCREIQARLVKFRKEYDEMMTFLKAQGIKPDAQKMPQFSNLLAGVKPEEEFSSAELLDEDGNPF